VTTLRDVEILGIPGTRNIVVDGRKIREVTADARSAEHEIVFGDAIAFPGLINSHDHLEFDAYEQLDGGPYSDYVEWAEVIRSRHASRIAAVESIPRQMRVRMGIAKNLICGVTSVAHHGPKAECAAAPIAVIGGTRSIHSPRLEGVRGLLTLDRRTVVVHVGEGIHDDSEHEIDEFLRWNIWRKRLIGVHAIAMRSDQAQRFSAIVWCPVSNEFLYGKTASISNLKHHVPVLFGTDSTITASWNIWNHLRRARELHQLNDDELIAAITTRAAKVWRLRDHGSIVAGAVADLVIARKRREDQCAAFFAINPEDILLVMKGGEVILVDASFGQYWQEGSARFPLVVNDVEKFVIEDCSELVTHLQRVFRKG
jgi:cytosine/adenosine deaminase-related metal-dependent hydrolase